MRAAAIDSGNDKTRRLVELTGLEQQRIEAERQRLVMPDVFGVLAVMSGSPRVEIIRRLSIGPCDVKSLAAELDLGITLVSQNLKILKEHSLVVVTAVGSRRVYELSRIIQTHIQGLSMRVRVRCTPKNWLVFNAELR